ncbi:MAG: HAD family hydrolase [Chloroflexota bacterium]
MGIRLLTIDLDGTLAVNIDNVPTRTAKAIADTMAKGVFVSVATGREYNAAARVAKALNLNSPVICYQGNIIRDHRTNTLLSATFVPLDICRQFIKFAREQKFPLVLFMEQGNYTELPTPLMKAEVVTHGTPVSTVNNLLTLLDEQSKPLKLLTVQPADQTPAVFEAISQTFGDQLTVVRSADMYVEAFWPTASKGAALEFLATQHEIDMTNTMAIGDHDNDISMLEKAGVSVAMGNGSPGAKKAAGIIAPSVAEEGVAWAIETYILEKTHDTDC